MNSNPDAAALGSGPLPRGWTIVFCLWFVAGLNYLDRLILTTMRESLVEAIPMSEAQFGLLTSIFLFVYGCFSPFAGFLADRFNRSTVIVGSVFLWSVITWLTGHASNYTELLLARAAMGVTEACYIPAALALIVDYHRGTTRSFATGLHLSGISVGSSLGGLGGVLASSHGWWFPFQVFGIIGMVYSIFLACIVRDPPKPKIIDRPKERAEEVGFADAFAHLFRNGRYWLLVACVSSLGLAGWAMNGWMPTYLMDEFDLGQGQAGMTATGYLHVAGFFGCLFGGYITDLWTRRNPAGRMLVPIIGLCIAAPAIVLSTTSSVLVFALTGLVIYGLCRHLVDSNLMPILCIIADHRYRATGYGFMNFCSCMVGGIGIYAGGVVRDNNIDVSVLFHVAGGGLLLAALLIWLIRPIEKPHSLP
jgi:predicted MFS family arabinose efflux permease